MRLTRAYGSSSGKWIVADMISAGHAPEHCLVFRMKVFQEEKYSYEGFDENSVSVRQKKLAKTWFLLRKSKTGGKYSRKSARMKKPGRKNAEGIMGTKGIYSAEEKQ